MVTYQTSWHDLIAVLACLPLLGGIGLLTALAVGLCQAAGKAAPEPEERDEE